MNEEYVLGHSEIDILTPPSSSSFFSSKIPQKVRQVFNNLISMGFNKKRLIRIFSLPAPYDEIHSKEQILNIYIDLYYASEYDENQDLFINDENLFEGSKRKIRSSAKSLSFQKIVDSSLETKKINSVLIQINQSNFERNSQLLEPLVEPGFECGICFANCQNDEMYKMKSCSHFFCSMCIENYLIDLITDGKVSSLRCPFINCTSNISEKEMEDIIKNEQIISKFYKFKKRLEIDLNPNLCWCIRPGCENWVVGNAKDPKTICTCGQIICFNCMNEWHEGRSCQEAIDEDYKKYTKSNLVKKCPKCKSRIEKNEGCNHMHCTQCKYDFCWLCGRKYASGHYDWFNIFGCPNRAYAQIAETRRGKICFWIKLIAVIIFTSISILFLIALGLAFLPVGFVLLGMATPVLVYRKYCVPNLNFQGILGGVLVFLIGLPFLPIILILMIIPGTCIAICCKEMMEDIYF